MRKFIILIVAIIATSTYGQKFPFHKNYEWEDEPTQMDLGLTDPLYYYTKYVQAVEYKFDEYRGQFYKYTTIHYRVKLSSDYAIEDFNKIYISMKDVISLVNVDARLIKEDEVVDMKPKVEEFFSEDEQEQYYYFPIAGLELGDELELIYTVKKEPEFNGDQFYFQGEIPIYNFDFYFIAPNDSYFNFLPHNGLAEPELVDTILQRNQWTIHMDTIPEFKSEYFCEYSNVVMKLDASLRGFDKPSDNSYSPYDDYMVSLNIVYNQVYGGKDAKALNQLSENLGIKHSNSIEENVRLIENYVKMQIAYEANVPWTQPVIADMIETEKAGTIGSILLFMALLQENAIDYKYGFVSDRYDTFFSEEIESLFFLQSYFIYIPDIDKYLAPLDFTSRLGFLDKSWVPNNGIFFTSKQYPYPSTKSKIKAIPFTPATDNTDSTVVRIKLNEAMDDLEVSIEVYLTGYEAGGEQVYYYLYGDERRKDVHEELLDVLNDNSKIKMTEISGMEPESAYVKTLMIKGDVTELSTTLIEKAGETTIFKLGNLFGEYIDVDEIKKKLTDFVFGHAFISSSTYIIEFPQGVKISNTENILKEEDGVHYEGIVVESTLDINDNVLTYKQREEFHSTRYGIGKMDQMIDVFNFYNGLNKMNLVVEK